jgi:hypothetical protein
MRRLGRDIAAVESLRAVDPVRACAAGRGLGPALQRFVETIRAAETEIAACAPACREPDYEPSARHLPAPAGALTLVVLPRCGQRHAVSPHAARWRWVVAAEAPAREGPFARSC